jgi:hypothetical protein
MSNLLEKLSQIKQVINVYPAKRVGQRATGIDPAGYAGIFAG